ncbi:MAG: macro domain-containing protein [Elusimicrobiota bacterium]
MAQKIRLTDEGGTVQLHIGDGKLSLHKGDILTLKADALVCPVDQKFSLNSGLARIVSHAAGQQISQEKPQTHESFGKVVVFPGGKLNVKYIFMTVLMGEKDPEKMKRVIQQAVDRTIRYAEFLRLKSIAFPLLGSAEVSPPFEAVAKYMMEEVNQYFHRRRTKIEAVLFSAINPTAYQAFCKEAKNISE